MQVYKYISFEQFVYMGELQKLYLKKVSKWEDVYEGYLLKEIFDQINHPLKGLINLLKEPLINLGINSLYGQSWTYASEESSAMWEIYCPQKNGVRISFDSEYIFSQINKTALTVQQKKFCNKFRIKYNDKPCNKLKISSEATLAKSIIDTLKYKRIAFKHEKEYRFAFVLPQYVKKLTNTLTGHGNILMTDKYVEDIYKEATKIKDYIYYDVAIDKLNEVLLHPNAEKYQKILFEKYCLGKNIQNYKVSKLYELPKKTLALQGKNCFLIR